jgi:hypothetical protein
MTGLILLAGSAAAAISIVDERTGDRLPRAVQIALYMCLPAALCFDYSIYYC